MPQSKKRGGAKAHRKRVENRNNKIKHEEIMVEKLRQKIFLEAKARYEQEQQQSGKTENVWNIS
jgi:hypothetical protein